MSNVALDIPKLSLGEFLKILEVYSDYNNFEGFDPFPSMVARKKASVCGSLKTTFSEMFKNVDENKWNDFISDIVSGNLDINFKNYGVVSVEYNTVSFCRSGHSYVDNALCIIHDWLSSTNRQLTNYKFDRGVGADGLEHSVRVVGILGAYQYDHMVMIADRVLNTEPSQSIKTMVSYGGSDGITRDSCFGILLNMLLEFFADVYRSGFIHTMKVEDIA